MFVQQPPLDELYAFTDWALRNGKTVNQFYFPRSLGGVIEQELEKSLAEPDETELFLFFEKDKSQCLAYNLNYYFVDGYLVGCRKALQHAERLSIP